MTALALCLLAVVVAEHALAWWPDGRSARWLRPLLVVLVVALLGATVGADVGTTVAVAAVGLLWGLVRDEHPWEVAGVVATGGLVLLVALARPVGLRPSLQRAWSDVHLPALADVPPQEALLGLAVVLFLLRPANAVVRIVLDHAGEGVLGEERTLRGGRLLGPLERVLIFAMAVAGVYGVLAVVVAAKGILRFPEISRDQPDGTRAEYVLVGSFVSWSLALLFVPLF